MLRVPLDKPPTPTLTLAPAPALHDRHYQQLLHPNFVIARFGRKGPRQSPDFMGWVVKQVVF
jgi:hypothetical protein